MIKRQTLTKVSFRKKLYLNYLYWECLEEFVPAEESRRRVQWLLAGPLHPIAIKPARLLSSIMHGQWIND